MKTHYLMTMVGLVLFVACGGTRSPENNLQAESAAPAFSVHDQNGKTVTFCR